MKLQIGKIIHFQNDIQGDRINMVRITATILVASLIAAPCWAREATPSNNPMLWITTEDLPGGVLKTGEMARSTARLTASTNGKVSACAIVESSGIAKLDMLTCKLLTKRARFNPATNEAGAAVESETTYTAKWASVETIMQSGKARMILPPR